ncbi:TPA: membrane-bound PQQ-dependent dehydrogenase, glucose/quinate/shikimate family [Burkholderia cenocepacia]|uniref:membrane-bound PQQ-dependent dehydrogenase, glucose/quinate/shikimate family n=2 Tax=Burkholderia cenocepacia TaxID=95486 RepID=UPI0009B1CAEF|nr:membrane-bound PQQ-dependent dehydrogenase, glucose/quinate/shikimate family [Burkholderia cenocepacia]MCW3686851.1 membrane-bound PQQ-dependent dehydrogenase, glucose/quinate/shikimate family [Burkholderia cenocepacia]QUO29201.1 membrane-bound PQQ-dependent dehydrogenase, glucose/quinate/shikimate family [Burkholderia cenocepacia]
MSNKMINLNRFLPIWDRVIAAVILISGLAMLFGGIGLLLLDGSPYYIIAGALLVWSGWLLWRRRLLGATVFGVIYAITLLWTLYETASRLWGWVPRMGFLTGLAFFVALMLPRLVSAGGLSGYGRNLAKILAAGCVAFAGVAFALSFIPQQSFLSDAPMTGEQLVSDGARRAAQRAGQPDADWRHYGRDTDATRYSPLDQINSSNVSKLKVAWVYHTGDLPPKGKANKWAAEMTPIKVGDGLYLCTATNNLAKLDPTTGKAIWTHDVGTRYESVPYTAACRGLVHHVSKTIPVGRQCHEKIIEGTIDGRLIAVDATTGASCEGFGEHGQVSLLKGLGKTVPGFVAMTSPPVIVNGTIVANHEVLDGQRRWAPSGVIRGYDADTGAFKWAWDVNRPGQRGEPGPGEEYSRGTPNSWGPLAGDDSLGLVYIPTGNSAADYYSAMRTPNENRVASAIVALDAATGEERWVFQTAHKDVWDYDIGSQPTLFEFPTSNGSVPAMVIPTKRGQLFVVDRRDGKPLLPVEEQPAPPGNVPNDPRAPTQPWSTRMPRLAFPDLQEKTMWGMTPFDQLYCRIKFRQAHYVGEFTPPVTDKPWIEYPGYNGGVDWGSVAYDPTKGVLIANWNVTPMYDRLLSRKEADSMGLFSKDDPRHTEKSTAEGPGAMADTPYGIDVEPFLMPLTKVLCNEPPYGMITAIDMHNQKVVWQHPFGTARANGPFGLPTYMPIQVGTPNNGGPIITAGNLIFAGAATDNLLHAFDQKTGKMVWTDLLPGGGQATPMTYSANGKQYVVIMAGGHHFMETPISDALVAYALPDDVVSGAVPRK